MDDIVYRFDVFLKDTGFAYTDIYEITDEKAIKAVDKFLNLDKICQLDFGLLNCCSFLYRDKDALDYFRDGMMTRDYLPTFLKNAQDMQAKYVEIEKQKEEEEKGWD
jgi:hypothetical protein